MGLKGVGGLGGSGCPCPLRSSFTLPRATGGARQRKAIPGEEVGRPPVVTAPWNSPIRTPQETGLHPRCREGVAGRTRALASPMNLGTHCPAFPRSRARITRLSGRNLKSQNSGVAGCKEQGDKETETSRENQSAPAGVGREQPKCRCPLLLFSHVPSPTLEGSPPNSLSGIPLASV